MTVARQQRGHDVTARRARRIGPHGQPEHRESLTVRTTPSASLGESEPSGLGGRGISIARGGATPEQEGAARAALDALRKHPLTDLEWAEVKRNLTRLFTLVMRWQEGGETH